MVKVPFACNECHKILDGDSCPAHPGAMTTTNWVGYVVILDVSRSEIAEHLKIDAPGAYALKVNPPR